MVAFVPLRIKGLQKAGRWVVVSAPARGETSVVVLRECAEGMQWTKVMRISCILFSVCAADRSEVLGYSHSDEEPA